VSSPDSPEGTSPVPLRVTAWHRVRDFLYRVWTKAGDDHIFFMAGAITFNLLVAFIPLVLLAVGIAGSILSARVPDPSGVVVRLIVDAVPAVGGEIDLVNRVRGAIQRLLDESAGFSLLGAVILVWVSTRLVGTLRTVLEDVFDVAQERGILAGKLFDAQMVVVGGILVTVNVGVTVSVRAVQRFGVDLLGLQGTGVQLMDAILPWALSFFSIWVLFLLIYRYVPARPTPWRTSLVAATFTAVLFEATKWGFSWYATELADYTTAFGNLTTVAVLFLWTYYGSIVFILGGEVAQVYTMRRAWRMRTERGSGGFVGLLAGALVGAGGLLPGGVAGQDLSWDNGVLFSASAVEREVEIATPFLETAERYVVVHIAENRVFVVEGDRSVWSAPAGTGHGFRLEGAGQRWTFTTPKGLFRVRRMEKDPMWEAPDWYYVQRGMNPPPLGHPSRMMPGVMGTTAIYLGDGIAIHGTSQPELLLHPDPERRRVSHGCIRLTNEAARELLHMVDVGTPVLIY